MLPVIVLRHIDRRLAVNNIEDRAARGRCGGGIRGHPLLRRHRQQPGAETASRITLRHLRFQNISAQTYDRLTRDHPLIAPLCALLRKIADRSSPTTRGKRERRLTVLVRQWADECERNADPLPGHDVADPHGEDVRAPRYIPGPALADTAVGDGYADDTDAVPDASRITPPVLMPGFPNPVRLSIDVGVDPAGLSLSDVRSTLHTVNADEGRFKVQPASGPTGISCSDCVTDQAISPTR